MASHSKSSTISAREGVFIPKRWITVGGMAQLAGVAPRTVSKWCDKDLLQYHRLPASLDRRILIRDAIRFLGKHNYLTEARKLMSYVKPSVYFVAIDEIKVSAISQYLLPYSVKPTSFPNAVAAASELNRQAASAILVSSLVSIEYVCALYEAAEETVKEFGYPLSFIKLVGDEGVGITCGYKDMIVYAESTCPQILVERIAKSLPLRGPMEHEG